MTDKEYEEWRELMDKMINELPFDSEMTHIDGIVDFRDDLLLKFKQRLETPSTRNACYLHNYGKI